MAKRAGKTLDVKTIAALKPREATYRVSDGGGLLLEVRPTGSKAWLCRITTNGKRRDLGLGGYPVVTLAAARTKATEALRQAQSGVDPVEHRSMVERQRKAVQHAKEQASERTFRVVAEACISAEAPGWKNPRTDDMWRNSLRDYAFPTIGDMPVDAIDRNAVMAAVGDVWSAKPATARKVLRRIGAVLRFAAAKGWRANDNVTELRMLRYAGLPALRGGRKQPALPWARMPAFMEALGAMPGLAPQALRFLALTALRSNEVREARWSWLSFDGVPTLTIPGEHMKGKKSADVQPHRVPLSDAALAALATAYTMATGASARVEQLGGLVPLMKDSLIFPSRKSAVPLSDMALSAVMRRMNADRPPDTLAPWRDPDGRDAVPHGFRATFSTWIDDTRPEDREAAERVLAHEMGNKVSAAYRRSDLFDRRVPLMDAWAGHCAVRACVNDREKSGF